jgi:hypothetical protein
LQALGVQPVLGRWFSKADDMPSSADPEPVSLSYAYWQRGFGGDQAVLGRSLNVDSHLRQIVGVMPAGLETSTWSPN